MGIIKVYADRECKKPIKTIEWKDKLILTLVTGEKKEFPNTTKAGEIASAIVYLRNESRFPYAITDISFPDDRVFLKIDKAFLEPSRVARLAISFQVPEKITPEDVIKAGKISIEAYYIYGVG